MTATLGVLRLRARLRAHLRASFGSKRLIVAALALIAACSADQSTAVLGASDSSALAKKGSGGGGGGGGTTNPTPAAITVTGISISPTRVSGGAAAKATVLLSGPAPAGGLQVGVTSNNTTAATAETPLNVAEGETAAIFTITTHPVAALSSAAISANAGGVTQTAVVTVLPSGVVAGSLTLSPTVIAAGQTSTATVNLTGPAPDSGAAVALASSDPTKASVPAQLIVPAGATIATFAVTGENGAASDRVNISATFGGVTQVAGIVVNPPAPTGAVVTRLTIAPNTVVGGTSAQGTVTIASAVGTNTSVTLASTTPSVATVPASVIVPAGATSATFVVNTATNNSGQGQFAEISASAGGGSAFATITTTPAFNGPTVASVSIVPTRIGGGGPATGTVTLRGANTQGAVVTLASADPSVVQVPATVVLGPNVASVAFPVTTSRVSSNTTVLIIAGATASSQGSASGALTVTTDPPPAPDRVTIQSASFQFVGGRGGNVTVKAQSTNPNAILSVFPDSSPSARVVLTNLGGGRYEGLFATEIVPATVTVRSNLGGTATANVKR